MTAPILIVGAGPTGLNLALSLARRGIRFRLISDAEGPGEHSRAMVVQARTLEFYGQYGFAEDVIQRGVIAEAVHLREAIAGKSREILTFSFKDLGEGLSPYPFALAYPQDDHERFLIDKLRAAGGGVEWRSSLVGFSQDENGVHAKVSRDGETLAIDASYICGCDGSHSAVREILGIGFPGGSYQQLFYVADVNLGNRFERDLHMSLGEHILSLMFPVRSSGMQRLIGLVPPELSDRSDLSFEDVRDHVEPLLDIRVKDINWFSTYRVHHRVADRFQVKRAFLLGDAGHIHSPAGGQGMNTGIGDAINLGWKLAQVWQERAAPSLLETYEPERIGFARALVSTTDRAFTPMVAEGLQGEIARRVLAPFLVTVATRLALGRHAIFRLVSQIRVHYEESSLSEGKAGEVRGGDRLPWIRIRAKDNFEPLKSLDWQLHIYGEPTENLRRACGDLSLPVHGLGWTEAADTAGFKRDAAYLVRPDGHVALAMAEQDPAALHAFVRHHQFHFQVATPGQPTCP